MAKKAEKKAEKKAGGRMMADEARPSYAKLTAELNAVTETLLKILVAGRDDKGELGPVQTAQAMASLKALQGAQKSLECPQLFGPYTSKPS